MTSPDVEHPQAAGPVAVEQNPLGRLIPLGVWLVTLLTLCWIPLKVISYGYLPPDDSLRHAGKGVSQKDWNDILVLRDGFRMDASPGWHWIQEKLHRVTGMETDGLVSTSVIAAFFLALVIPIAGLRRPEAWVGALLISMFTFPQVIYRVLYGRPLALTMAVVLYVLLLWRRADSRPVTWERLAITTGLLALSSWIHGCWYLFALVIAAFVLAGQWRSSFWLTICWIVGTIGGALLTGDPIDYLAFQIRIMSNSFVESPLLRMLVMEYQPTDGNILAVLTVVVLLGWRCLSGTWTWNCVRNPIFLLAVLGWILGLKLGRFFFDWGQPALLLWIAMELGEHLNRQAPAEAVSRFGLTAALSLALTFAVTTDSNSRWTRALDIEFLTETDPEMKPWLPEKDGILYSADMGVFYQTFFKNPHADWRYILGFNDIFMPLEDLKILRNIQRNYGSFKAYEPWVKKLRPNDRLVIRSMESAPPTIAALEWHYTAREIWVGRTRRAQSTESPGIPPGTVAESSSLPAVGN